MVDRISTGHLTSATETASQPEAHNIAAAVAAVGQVTRVELMRMLAECAPFGMSAGQLAEKLAMPPASLSFHFRQLVGVGLVRQCRRSRNIIYTLDQDRMELLFGVLIGWFGLFPATSGAAASTARLDAVRSRRKTAQAVRGDVPLLQGR